jgi:hypothetical protein
MVMVSVFVCGVCVVMMGVGAAQPTVESISLNPGEPSALSAITFTAMVTSETSVDTVQVIVKECKPSICYTDGFNESMDLVDTNTYNASVTLKHADATYIEYHLEMESGGEWFASDITTVNLTSAGDGTTDGGNGTNKTPGFELLLVIGAFVVVVVVYTRKRRQ